MTTNLKPLTVESVTAAIRKAVEDRGGDYLYRSPGGAAVGQYFHGSEPGCIVGYVLAEHGYTQDDLRLSAPGGITDPNMSSVFSLDIPLEDHLLYALGKAQGRQDSGETWGSAEEAYLNRMGVGNNDNRRSR